MIRRLPFPFWRHRHPGIHRGKLGHHGVLVIVSILLTRNLKVNHISKRQAILETAVVTMDNFSKICWAKPANSMCRT